MSVTDWSTSASLNSAVAGINIAPGMARSDVDNAIRAIMAELKTYFTTPQTSDAWVSITTQAGAGLYRGLAVEHYADTTGSYGVDIHSYQGAKNSLTVHHYSNENGAVAGGVAVQFDHTRDGNILVLKNAENSVTSPGTKGTASFITGIGYIGPTQTTPGTLFQWTHQNVLLTPSDDWPFTVSGKGMEVICDTTASRCFKSTSLNDSVYAIQAEGTKYALYCTTSQNSGFVGGFVKNGTGAGTVLGVFNKGTGDNLIAYDTSTGANVEKAKIDSAGQYYVQTNRVLSTRKTGWTTPTGTATRTGFATSTATTTQLAETLKALIDDLVGHGLIGA